MISRRDACARRFRSADLQDLLFTLRVFNVGLHFTHFLFELCTTSIFSTLRDCLAASNNSPINCIVDNVLTVPTLKHTTT